MTSTIMRVGLEPNTSPKPLQWAPKRLMRFLTPGRTFAIGACIYLLLCALSFLVVRPTTQVYFSDYWEHRAIVEEVLRHGSTLGDPIYGEAVPSRQFTPWTFAMGYLARLAHLDVDSVMAIGGLFVSALFVAGVYAFGRSYFAHRWAPAILLASVTCAWFAPPLMWTGFHSLRSQIHANYYPASLVFALTFVAWALLVNVARAPRIGPRQMVPAVLLPAVVAISFITHPLNAVFLLAGAGALALFEPHLTLARRALLFALLAGGLAASALWPFFNPLSLAGAGLARGQATFNNFPFFYNPMFVVTLFCPALVAMFAAKAQLLDPRRRVPVIAFVAITAAYVVGEAADISIAHRFLDYMALAAQLMLVWLVLDVIDGRAPAALAGVSRVSWSLAGFVALLLIAVHVALAAEQLVHPWARANADYPLHDVNAEMRRVTSVLPSDTRLLGWDSAALVMPSYGIKVVAIPRPMPFSPSDAARQADYRRFFAPETPACERRDIAARWGATHIAYLTDEVRPPLQRRLQHDLGPATSPVGSWRIIPAPGRCR